MDRRRSIVLAPVAGIATVLLAATPASAAATWAAVSSQAVGTSSSFTAIDLLSAASGWAVGSSPAGGLVERWDGATWKTVASPNILPLGNSFAGLSGVDAVNASTAFAVGTASSYGDDGLLHGAGVALQWNGSTWRQMSMPSSTAIINSLSDIKAISATNAWAVGRTVAAVDGRTLALHWNGTSWSVVATPSPSTRDNLLIAVDGTSPSDVWAVGYYRDPPYGNTAQHSLILHWDGSSWTRVASPDVGTNQTRLRDVVAISPDNAWAVGSTNINSVGANDSSAVLHWTNGKWTTVAPPALASLWSVTALSATDIWVAGKTADGIAQMANWTGSGWTITPSPGSGSTATPTLMGTAAIGPHTVQAVGQLTNPDGTSRPLAIQTTTG